ncbi:MAG: DCC1-like thiol-disulfide oxidoreductase family protein [Bacteroidales bacterium]
MLIIDLPKTKTLLIGLIFTMAKQPKHIVFFDSVCNLCHGSVKLIVKNNNKKDIYFTGMFSTTANRLLPLAPQSVRQSDSIIFYTNGRWFHKSTAALKIAQHLRFPWNAFSILLILPAGLRDSLYDWIARNRYQWFGTKQSCKIPAPGHQKHFSSNYLK